MSKQGFDYWFQWQVPVCALLFIIPAVVAVRYIKKEKAEPLRSFDLWNCCWRNLSPIWLLLYRAFSFICLAWMLYSTVSITGPFVFFFYTQWTFSLVMLYFALGTVISAHGCWMSTKKSSSEEGTTTFEEEEFKDKIKLSSSHAKKEINQNAGLWGYLMQAMYQTCAGASILTDLVFWCLLVPLLANVQFELTLLIGCLHAVNVVFLIGDTALNGLPFKWFGFAYFVLWSCLYITFQWIVHACGFMTWWPYPFLELNTPWAPLWYFGVALFHIPCYWIYTQLFKAKNYVLPRLFPRAFVRLN
ncbi:uncharacterized protein LOC133032796 [Cannabis sativa]|uniref:Transmembrane protein n=1 Tax=Cannabis sativa TaxID=3483 RepID=A0A7J6GKP7_CANSA|nr:uncharacterized protein LOC115711120 [Cannabis sativa]XP_060963251.1 uncharacterized protein LOC133032796 [Cannabis sativa]KAF4383496.1 hypothetical protein F8388_013996 [Cannabis sativa]